MRVKLQKWGDSLAIRIPGAFASEVGFGRGEEVEISLGDGELVISPVGQKSYSLGELLSGVSEQNLHSEVSTDPPVGGEVW